MLVCNAYAFPAPRREQIPKRREADAVGREIFDGLYKECRPRTVVVHGAEAVKLAASYFGATLDVTVALEDQDTTVGGGRTRMYAFPHFSGMGAPRGFPVSQMDAQLERLAARIVASHSS